MSRYPKKIAERELDRITQIIGDTHPNALLFDNVPSDMTWGELVQCVSDLLEQGRPLSTTEDPHT